MKDSNKGIVDLKRVHCMHVHVDYIIELLDINFVLYTSAKVRIIHYSIPPFQTSTPQGVSPPR